MINGIKKGKKSASVDYIYWGGLDIQQGTAIIQSLLLTCVHTSKGEKHSLRKKMVHAFCAAAGQIVQSFSYLVNSGGGGGGGYDFFFFFFFFLGVIIMIILH